MAENWNSLIDFSKIPGGIISGLEAKEIETLAQKSMSSHSILTPTIISNDLNADQEFEAIDEDIMKELDEAEKLLLNKHTVSQTTTYMDMFKKFLIEKKLSLNVEVMPLVVLNDYLRFFYSSLKTKQGNFYAPTTLLCIRSSINRHLNAMNPTRNINLASDIEFETSNRMMKNMVGKFIQAGGKLKKHEPLEANDMAKISAHFTRENPTVLQDEIIFSIIYYFGQRGREHIRNFTKEDLSLSTDEDEKRYVYMTQGLPSKNVKASTSRSEFTDVKQCKMYEDLRDEKKCPVTAFELYTQKLPANSNNLFPKPLQKFDNGTWYSSKAVRGKDYMGNIMKKLSSELKLSSSFTNHSIRSTVVSNMMDLGFDTTDISAVTGHKSAESLRKYATCKRKSQIEKYSSSLSSSLHGSLVSQEVIASKKPANTTNISNVTLSPTQIVSSLFGSGNQIHIGTININYK